MFFAQYFIILRRELTLHCEVAKSLYRVSLLRESLSVMLAKPTSWAMSGEELTRGPGSGRNITKRAIPFKARQNEWARTIYCPSQLVR